MKIHNTLYLINFVFLILLSSSIHSQKSIVIKYKDNTESSSPLSSINNLRFSNSNLLIKTVSSIQITYPLPEINKITFSLYSSVSTINKDEKVIIYPNPATDFINLKNLNSDKINIDIYSLEGVLIKKCLLENDSQSIEIISLPKGLYFLKANSTTLKFTKK